MFKYILLTAMLCHALLFFSQTSSGKSGAIDTPTGLTLKQVPDSVFTHVDEEAKFPGGLQGWKRFLERNLRGEAPILDRSPSGIYSVTVQFIVDKDGVVGDVKAIQATEGCRTCISEAVRVMKRGPKWIPAKHNGVPVKYQAKQTINFLMV